MPRFTIPFSTTNPASSEQSDPFYADGGFFDDEGLPTYFTPVYSIVEAGIAGYNANTITTWQIIATFNVERDEPDDEGTTDTSEYNVAAFGISVDGSPRQYLVNNGDSANFSVGNGVVNIEQIDRQQNTADGSAFQRIRITPVSSPFNSSWSYLQNSSSNTVTEDTVSLFSNFPEANTYVGLTAWTEPNPDTYNVEYSFEMQYDGVAETITVSGPAPDDPDTEFVFGAAVAFAKDNANTMVIGSYSDNNRTGSAYIFNAMNGIPIAKITASDGVEGDRFGFAVAADNNRIIVSAYLKENSSGDAQAGAVYIFDYSGTQLQIIQPDDLSSRDRLGGEKNSVAVGNNLFVIGSGSQDSVGINAGATYVYDLNYNLIFKLLPDPDGTGNPNYSGANQLFGNSVAVNDNRIVVGAPFDDPVVSGVVWGGAGSAYMYNAQTGNRIIKLANPQIDTYGADALNTRFGSSVAIDNNRIVIGASFGINTIQTESIIRSGCAFIFDLNGNLQATISPADGEILDFYGDSVDIQDDRIVVGSPRARNPVSGSNEGAAYIYDLSGNFIARVQGNGTVNGLFGNKVSVSSDKIMVGAPNQGTVYFFDLNGNSINYGSEQTVITDETFVKTINIDKNYYFQYTPYISAVPAVVEQGQR